MTLEQLRIFVAVAEREHVTQAARDINLTQSATSSAIAALEACYDTRLFNRVGRRIELTEAGRLFLVEARAVLARAEAAERVLADLAGLRRGALRLAASQTVGNYWLPPQMQRFHARYPGIALGLMIGNSEQVAGWVRDGTAELGFIEGLVDDPALAVRPVAGDELVLVAAAGHPLADRRLGGLEELGALRWVLREAGSGTRAMFEAALREAGQDPAALEVAMELPSNEAVRAAVEAGAGVTAISRLVVESALQAGRLVRIAAPLPTRRFLVLRHKERYVTRAEQELLSLLDTGA
jgi:DNA-binding transcriptional LysR family regulator